MARKHKHPEHVNLERWLVSYADFITLLFAFFVVMYAISQADLAKLKDVTKSIRSAFSYSAPSSMLDQGKMAGKELADLSTLTKGAISDAAAGNSNLGADYEIEQLVALQSTIEEAMVVALESPEWMNEFFDFPSITDEGLTIRLMSDKMFDPGSDQLKESIFPILDKLIGILKWNKNKLRVEGHTDNVPIQNVKFTSNWDLSASRATNVVRYMVANHGFDTKRLSIGAYADTLPITTNDTDSGRARNRRIEFAVLKKSK